MSLRVKRSTNFGGAALLTAGAIGTAAWAVRGRSSGVFGPNIWHGSRSVHAIALTFDDGPSAGTEAVLNVLDRYRVPATFFQCGANVEALPHISREVIHRGHEIGNHSYSHSLFAGKRPGSVVEDFARAQAAIEVATETRPSLLRAPYGVRWFGFGKVPLTGVMWDVIARDWKLPAADIARRVLSNVQNGSILCLHDGRELNRDAPIENTLGGIRWIVPALLDRGFEFCTVSQLLCKMK